MKELANKSELRLIVKEYEEIDITDMVTPEQLVDMATNGYDPKYGCPLTEIKETMEEYIQANLRKIRTQLPDCNGKCTQFGCPNLVVVNCYDKLKPILEK